MPLLEQKELDLGHDKTDLKSSGSAIILFYLAVCQPDHIYIPVMSPVLVLREAASLIYMKSGSLSLLLIGCVM